MLPLHTSPAHPSIAGLSWGHAATAKCFGFRRRRAGLAYRGARYGPQRDFLLRRNKTRAFAAAALPSPVRITGAGLARVSRGREDYGCATRGSGVPCGEPSSSTDARRSAASGSGWIRESPRAGPASASGAGDGVRSSGHSMPDAAAPASGIDPRMTSLRMPGPEETLPQPGRPRPCQARKSGRTCWT